MVSNFPAALPASKNDYDSNDLVASADQNAQADDINAIAAKVGIDGSTDPNSLEYRVTNAVVLEAATGAEVNTGSDNVKYVTPKAIEDSNVARTTDIPVKATGIETNLGTNDTKFVTPLASMTGKTILTSYAPAGAGTTTLDLSLGSQFKVTMPAATQTLAISNATVGQAFILDIVNTTDQGVLTWWAGISWYGGSAPTLTGENSKTDPFGFRVTSAGVYKGCIVGLNA